MSGYRVLTMLGTDPGLEQYKYMIYSDFKRSLRYGSDFFKLVDAESFYDTYEVIITHILKRPDCVIRLAVLEDDYDVCIGWSMSEGTRLHFVYVKKDMRKQGIATNLIPKDIAQITHITKIGQSIWLNKAPHIKFSPFY